MKKTSSSRTTILKWTCILFLLPAGLGTAVYALDYLGAATLLQQVAERVANPATAPKVTDQSKLRDDLKSFSQASTNLAPADAASRWLELVDRAIKIQQRARYNYTPGNQPVGAEELLAALPPTADWSELAKAINARSPAKKGEETKEIGLRFLAATLTGDAEGRKHEIAGLESEAKNADAQTADFYDNILDQWSQATLATSDDPNAVLESLEYQLGSIGRRGAQSLNVPNLVSQVGADKAEAFLRKALTTPNVTLAFNQPNETSRLAQKLALELMDQLKTPQWGLVNSLDAVDLYEALDKHFGAQTNSTPLLPGLTGMIIPNANVPANNYEADQQKDVARVYYMLGLISKDRSKDAVAVAQKISGNNSYMFDAAFKQMEHAGYTVALDNFFYELLSQDPTLPFWDEYVQIAAGAGQTDRMLALARSTAARDDLSDAKKEAIQQILFQALLAADNVDGGVQEIRRMIAEDTASQSSGRYNAGQLGVMLARIGILETNSGWTDEGIKAAKQWLATPAGQNLSGWDAATVVDSLSQTLFETQRGPEAEAVLADALANATRPSNAPSQYNSGNNSAQQILADLAVLYHEAGRSDDVLNLLQQSPDWGVKDLSGLFETSPWDNGVSVMWLHTGSSPLPVPYLAASALLANGQKDEARKIVNELLFHYPGLDRGYELLIALDGTNAIPQLDDLFQRDQFEERPLIWKAHLLRQENRLDEAEKVIHQAIAIDPSDGEEGRGDRMRAYAELADILEARGNQKDADFYREIVKSIRMSEDADQFYQAGLLKHAITMYEAALNHFSDAYCIQSRLAIQLSALGQNEAAEEHYRRAYELMPDSFGRVESHCFGCERAFDGERAQSIAEKVFTKIAAERPDKPQVYYLLGYLRMEQERYNEARLNFLAAVRLDPDYLNAWVNMQTVSEQILVSSKDRDEMVFNILRLDPLQRHASSVNFSHVSDLPRLWNAVAVAESHRPEFSTNLLTLAASKTALEKQQPGPGDQFTEFHSMNEMVNGTENLSPARAVAETAFVQLAGEMIMNSYNFSDNY